ncbi:MAG: T9SS type A sorting domain-containing protein [Cyclobacteriaceae bacterium]|nr:T9SS type A sorting domain-containing protein [Cyclobacteriaceae bacterium]
MKNILLIFIFISTCAKAQTVGELWGVTYGGGTHDIGVIYKTAADGTGYVVKHNFTYSIPASRPYYSHLIQATNGKLYGMTQEGGNTNSGAMFEYDPVTGAFENKIDFNGTNGANPFGSLLQAANGKLYGMTRFGGSDNKGIIFEYDITTNVFTKKFDFTGANDGAGPTGNLIQTANGKIYGMANLGGLFNSGSMFEFDITTNTLTKRHDFTPSGADGTEPFGSLTLASNGKLYGMTLRGGTNNLGTVFEFNPTGNVYTKRVDMANANGVSPQGSLTSAANGKLYGMTFNGGANSVGVLFEFDPATNTYTKKIDMSSAEGSLPYGSLFLAGSGKLYGLTYAGGSGNGGVLFEYDVAGNTYTRKYNFGVNLNGVNPPGSPMIASNGKVYGMTINGGSPSTSSGVLFEYDLVTTNYKRIHFKNTEKGYYPDGGVIVANNKIYGMLTQGGVALNNGSGLLYEFDPVTSLYSIKFSFDVTNGDGPGGNSLMLANNNKIYGTTSLGGTNGTGVLFEFDPVTGVYTKKVDFFGTKGSRPRGQLVQAFNGKLYGVTNTDGANNRGTIFEYDLSGVYTVKYNFSDALGYNPGLKLELAANGKLYGTLKEGGVNNVGILFEYDPATNVYTKKYDFTLASAYPSRGLTISRNQKLYGFTEEGGLNDGGILYEYDLATNVFTKKFDVASGNNFGFSFGRMAVGCNGKLYGSTQDGGSSSTGQIFEYDPSTNVIVTKKDLSGLTGQYPKNGAIVFWPPPQPSITANTANIMAPVLTSSASAGNQWYLNFTAIGSATAQTYTVAQEGVYRVIASVNGCPSTFSNPLSFIVTGLEPLIKTPLVVYPNPTRSELMLDLSGFETDVPVAISVIDILGRNIQSAQGSGGQQVALDVRHYTAGQYRVIVQQGQNRVVKAFIKSL